MDNTLLDALRDKLYLLNNKVEGEWRDDWSRIYAKIQPQNRKTVDNALTAFSKGCISVIRTKADAITDEITRVLTSTKTQIDKESVRQLTTLVNPYFEPTVYTKRMANFVSSIQRKFKSMGLAFDEMISDMALSQSAFDAGVRHTTREAQLRITADLKILECQIHSDINSTCGTNSDQPINKGLRHLEEPMTMGIRMLPELSDSLAQFKKDYPDSAKAAFIMMRFNGPKTDQAIVKAIRKTFGTFGLSAIRADDKEYHTDLPQNVLTYIFGCDFGVAVFNHDEQSVFNPNVAYEVGYMLALKKKVCILKDKSLATLPTDLIGKLYKEFDPSDPKETIPSQLRKWAKDKGLRRTKVGRAKSKPSTNE